MELVLIVAALVVLDVGALLWGVDSRDVHLPPDRRPRGWFGATRGSRGL